MLFALESPHGGDSNKCTHYTILNIKKENHPHLSKARSFGFSLGTRERVRNSRGKRASVFEQLKIYCILILVEKGPIVLSVDAGVGCLDFLCPQLRRN